MPKRKVDKIIQELIRLLKEQFDDFRGLYLYGSQADGTSRKNSDIDVVAIFDRVTYRKSFDIGGIVSELMYKYDVYLDMYEYTTKELEKNPYYYNEVTTKGQYYAAA